MPEGDTIARAAAKLQKVLKGETITSVRSTASTPESVLGGVVADVTAIGKNLFILFASGRVLKTHLGMNGRWRVLRSLPKQDPEGKAIILTTKTSVCICERAQILTWTTGGEAGAKRSVDHLGPDILSPDFSVEEGVARIRALSTFTIADALLNQRAVCGIGNIFKNEVLFSTHTYPFTRVVDLPDEVLMRILATARRWMLHSAASSQGRMTRIGSPMRYWVYMRGRRPCSRCGTAIVRDVKGDEGRSTYYCPRCQAPVTTTKAR